MAIYGTALLAFCLIAGLTMGRVIGMAMSVDANVGGVGIAMLLLVFLSDRLQSRGLLAAPTRQGVLFWSSIYVPIVVAMAASQNVRAAAAGGPAAVTAGAVVVVVCFALVPALSRWGASKNQTDDAAASANSRKNDG